MLCRMGMAITVKPVSSGGHDTDMANGIGSSNDGQGYTKDLSSSDRYRTDVTVDTNSRPEDFLLAVTRISRRTAR